MHLVISTAGSAAQPFTIAGARRTARNPGSRSRFTTEEIQIFFNEIMGLGISTEDIAVLDARTERLGRWITDGGAILQEQP
jgi:hypothetical protein